ncbi:MAG TPA: hypothetical protein VFZ08_04600 [Terriglobia bacterium]|nr:hypothetical protein [Terriglobia bacterium]
MRLKRHGLLALMAALPLLWTPFSTSSAQSPSKQNLTITIRADKTEIGEGQNVVITALARQPDGKPAVGIMLHAQVNGKDWGAEYPSLPSGVAHLLLPLPDTGANSIVVTDGVHTSNAVTVKVHSRHFNIVDDPNHLVIMEYETWFGPGYAKWGKEEAVPILGRYSSLDPRILRQHALWFDEMGFNVVELDWTNNLTKPFPDSAAKECIAATNELYKVYSAMAQHPKILFLVGPEHNRWMNRKDIYAGPWFKEQLNFLYEHYVNNPKYREMYVKYEGKPLILLYLNGPRAGPLPDIQDSRFTIRYVGAWLQTTHAEKYGAWSWYDQKPIPTYYHGRVEALTVCDGYPATKPPAKNLSYWLSPDAGGKNYGATYRTQWHAALKYKPLFLFVNQWNEFVPPDQYNVNLSNDMEPTLITEKGDSRPSGWGFSYMRLTRDEIAAYHRAIQAAK